MHRSMFEGFGDTHGIIHYHHMLWGRQVYTGDHLLAKKERENRKKEKKKKKKKRSKFLYLSGTDVRRVAIISEKCRLPV